MIKFSLIFLVFLSSLSFAQTIPTLLNSDFVGDSYYTGDASGLTLNASFSGYDVLTLSCIDSYGNTSLSLSFDNVSDGFFLIDTNADEIMFFYDGTYHSSLMLNKMYMNAMSEARNSFRCFKKFKQFKTLKEGF